MRSCPVYQQAQATPHAPAMVTAQGTLDYAALDRSIAAAASGLAAAGVAPGNIVALLFTGSVDGTVLLWAVQRLGATALPLNPRLPADTVSDVIARAGASVIVTDQAHVPDVVPVLGREVLAGAPSSPAAPDATPSEGPAVLVLTSGSSGPPRLAALTLLNLYENARRSNQNIRLSPGDRWLLSLPLFHVSGLGVVCRCLEAGATVAAPEAGEDLATALDRYEVTQVSLVATQLYRLLAEDAGRQALRRLKAILLGGSAIPQALMETAHDLGLPLHTTYGMTEMASQIATTPPGASRRHLLTAGIPLAAETVRIGEDGQILVRGTTLFQGYLEGGTCYRPLQEGWFPTGDLGHFDAEGYLHVAGRMDNMFVVAGENVQPETVERLLVNHPGVLQARVVPVADPEYGHLPVAFVEMRDGAPLDAVALKAALRDGLPGFAVPRRFFPWPDALPGGGIKPRKKDLIAHAEAILQTEETP